MVRQLYVGAAVFYLTASGCNVSDAPLQTGGVSFDAGGSNTGEASMKTPPAGDAQAAADAEPGEGGPPNADSGATPLCPKALVVIESDFTSTNVSLVSSQGNVLSEVFISSGTTATGLSTPLSGDIVAPFSAPRSNRVVLVDRYPNSVLTWVDPASALVLGQLQVGTGFASNPHDYVEVSPSRAYVTRYETNASPGRMPYDGGGDLLIVDHQTFSITGRIDLSSPSDTQFSPHPDHVMLVGTEAWVVLHRWPASNFNSIGDARLIGVSTEDDQVRWSLDLTGIANCGGLARSPSGNTLALSCTGFSGQRGGVVLLDATVSPPVRKATFDVATKLGSQPGSSLAFINETSLLGVTLGEAGTHDDVAYTLDVTTANIETVYDGGAAFVLGDVRCDPGCADVCFLTDATTSMSGLRSWKIQGSSLGAPRLISVDPSVGLPPRAMGLL